ncbi:PTS cellobiose transporter subunit IIC [Fulvitalea axinellae]|uniref:PTS cellobiose transporter subunit IIC n=1 Tax=Fulvitalea axinellae TaxID=1182444 RepID=A0AAU9CFY4_9BACT|nr:PTS cellobiose transporter subunit IIC [Fulvitalea axinellae]
MVVRKRQEAIVPANAGDMRGQLEECVSVLGEKLNGKTAVRVSVFVNAVENESYAIAKKMVMERLTEFFGDKMPAIGVIAQPPLGVEVALELAYVEESDAKAQYKKADGVPYVVLDCGGRKELHASGMAEADLSKPMLELSRKAFVQATAVLNAEGLDFSDVVRQWNYIERITDMQEDIQHYQLYNEVRNEFYGATEWKAGFPAATGIGMSAGGVIIDLVAVSGDVRIVPIDNPDQIDAHRYGQKVLVGNNLSHGSEKTAPQFERAKYQGNGVAGDLFISGTASIKGELTIAIDDAAEQTRVTAKNIDTLISGDNLRPRELPATDDLRPDYIRVYVKRHDDFDAIRQVCEETYSEAQALYVIADVCRDNLLVEIEGYTFAR